LFVNLLFFFDRSEKLDEKDVELDTDDASQVVPFLADDIKPVTKDTQLFKYMANDKKAVK
jgi:hypothetical protein